MGKIAPGGSARERKLASQARHRERNRGRINAWNRAVRAGEVPEPPPPFDDLDLSPWTVSLLRRYLAPGQYERMLGVLRARIAASATAAGEAA